ncbi:endomembrane protein 70 protein family [Striga asiatica]|uniref:Transmembrane 9 superfamily member n=1 Tax=Striga asiatica TaxID=4170 RepID=A0A5A7QIU2_STRAF|nr:endomembrane protein 70 protein family [Striga asiatica]
MSAILEQVKLGDGDGGRHRLRWRARLDFGGRGLPNPIYNGGGEVKCTKVMQSESNSRDTIGNRITGRVSAIVLWFLLAISSAHSFYLPGVAPRDFTRRDELQVKVNKLSSTKTQLPYDFYYLKYCKPKKISNVAENLGEVLRGDRIENSVYTFHMRDEQTCTGACKVKLDARAAKDFKEKIDDEYRVNMILDNLPVAMLRQRRDGSSTTTYEHGFRVVSRRSMPGLSKEEKYFIHNHLSFRVVYHRDHETDSARIVGFEVTPVSIKHEFQEWDENNPKVTTCNPNTKNIVQGGAIRQEVDKDNEIIFTYDVTYKESEIKGASRWDTYLLMNDDQIHWFSIINSLMIVLFLSGMVAMIMMRTLYRDIANYNQLDSQDDAQEETGWKLVHGDVFRAPVIRAFFVFTWGQPDRHPAFRGDPRDNDLRLVGFSLSFQPWWVNDGYCPFVGFHGIIRWLLVRSSLQNVQGQ